LSSPQIVRFRKQKLDHRFRTRISHFGQGPRGRCPFDEKCALDKRACYTSQRSNVATRDPRRGTTHAIDMFFASTCFSLRSASFRTPKCALSPRSYPRASIHACIADGLVRGKAQNFFLLHLEQILSAGVACFCCILHLQPVFRTRSSLGFTRNTSCNTSLDVPFGRQLNRHVSKMLSILDPLPGGVLQSKTAVPISALNFGRHQRCHVLALCTEGFGSKKQRAEFRAGICGLDFLPSWREQARVTQIPSSEEQIHDCRFTNPTGPM
jgi:hypothetical protein